MRDPMPFTSDELVAARRWRGQANLGVAAVYHFDRLLATVDAANQRAELAEENLGHAENDVDIMRAETERIKGDVMDFATESIVRDLAATEPLVQLGDDIHGFWSRCGSCDGENRSSGMPVNHHDGCPWRRAREWVDANPPRHTPGYQL